jgi:hypothetical protein
MIKPQIKLVKSVILGLSSIILCLAGCQTSESGIPPVESTISAQSTQIAVLSTQIIEQDGENNTQWEVISYLSTQMPSALEGIKAAPENNTLTPTQYPITFTEYPLTVRTGIAEIDSVLDAITNPDIAARIELVSYITSACTTQDGLGGPPKCLPDEVEGTLVDTFPVLYSEGTHVRAENIENAFDFSVSGLITIYHTPMHEKQDDYWPVGEYALIFTLDDPDIPQLLTVRIDGGQIVRLDYSMIGPGQNVGWEGIDQFVLIPLN